MVGCFILGSGTIFNFEIGKYGDFTELREVIWKDNIDYFKEIGEKNDKRLKLWKVTIPTRNNVDYLDLKKNPHLEINVEQRFKGEELDPTWLVNKTFIEPPPEEHIHIIIQPPATKKRKAEETRKRKRLQYSPESKDGRQEEDKDVKLPYTPRQRGIGGTMFLTTEGDRVGNYEGIDLNSPDICSREQTIQKLVKKIYKAGFLLVRSPPMSGKTSLGQLLEQHLVKDSDIRVIRISCLWMGNPSGSWTYEEEFQRLMGITWKKFQEECFHIKTIFIIDEVQMLYVPNGEPMSASRHNGNVVWETIKRCQQVGNLFIIAFAAYGYKGAWDYSSTTCTIDVSPFAISSENTWSIEDVRFTKDEYKDYFLRFCRTHLGNIKDENDVKYLLKYVYNTTAGHPGLVAFFMNNIKNHFFPQLKYDDTLTFERIFLYLKSYRFMNAVNEGFRGYLHMQNLTPEEERLCDRVFRRPIDLRPNIEFDQIRLVKTNLLSEQDGKLDFASPYLRALYLQRRWGSTIRPTIPPQDFKSFLYGTFTKMNAEAIRNSYSVGKDGRLLERAWQMEFYRAATQILPADAFISPDVGTHWGSKGYLDFFVDDGRNWAIELLRDGENASDHKSRFEPRGIYKPIRDICKEWATIDIRCPGLRNDEPKYSGDCHWINVYCQEDWKSVIIEDKHKKIKVELMGEYS
ncbi:hypothetical protein RclHR1_03480005 [Rhizophagus clarus]|uniref:Crinkler (CRN) family protein n=1 Tax=Rhizophagus clarus TaxID=94130 RepID=A0A2Z6RS15_9GLOM|nr:hypothetical protein RclHR1_03480005 [Rhizophagus clarus]GES84546.1 crinkler (CRN) family protein [Rhizophagus clarus]